MPLLYLIMTYDFFPRKLSSSEFQGSNNHKIQRNLVSIPRKPVKYVSLWWDDIPTIGGSSTKSTVVTNPDGSSIEKFEIFDNMGNLLVSRQCKPPDSPESIDGIEYCNDLMKKFETYFINISKILMSKLN